MNQTARFPTHSRPASLGAVLSSLAAAARDTAAFIFVREAHAYFVAPRAMRHPVSARAQRFMRSGE